MRTPFLVPIALVFVATMASPALAQVSYDYARPGVYFQVQATNNIGGFRDNPESSVRTDTEHSWGASGSFGYRINDLFAVEFQGDWVAGFDSDVGPEASGEDIVGGAVTVNGRYYFNNEQWQPYALLGLGAGFFEIRNNNIPRLRKMQADLVLRFGGGIAWWFNDQVGAVFDASYVWPTGASDNIEELDYARFGWGFILKFGGD